MTAMLPRPDSPTPILDVAAVERYIAANLDGIMKRAAPRFLEHAEKLEQRAAKLRELAKTSFWPNADIAEAQRLEAWAERDRKTAARMMGEAQPVGADTS